MLDALHKSADDIPANDTEDSGHEGNDIGSEGDHEDDDADDDNDGNGDHDEGDHEDDDVDEDNDGNGDHDDGSDGDYDDYHDDRCDIDGYVSRDFLDPRMKTKQTRNVGGNVRDFQLIAPNAAEAPNVKSYLFSCDRLEGDKVCVCEFVMCYMISVNNILFTRCQSYTTICGCLPTLV